MSNLNIEYIGQYGTSGYACAAKGNIFYLSSKGHNICFSPLIFDNTKIDKDFTLDQKVCSLMNPLSKYDVQIIHTLPNLWSKVIDKVKKDYYVKKIGFCTWESEKIPKTWPNIINSNVDELWVPSTYNKKWFGLNGVKIPIQVFAHIFYKQDLPDRENISLKDCFGSIIPKDKFTYYCIADYIGRKGIDDLISCFNEIYEIYGDDIQLVLKTHRNNYLDKEKELLIQELKEKTKLLGKSIYLILDHLSNKSILEIHSLGDCYVSLHRGEGFGLSLYEAVNYDKQIVSTYYGGPVDYLQPKHAKVKYDLVDGWAHPDLMDALNKMIGVFEKKSS